MNGIAAFVGSVLFGAGYAATRSLLLRWGATDAEVAHAARVLVSAIGLHDEIGLAMGGVGLDLLEVLAVDQGALAPSQDCIAALDVLRKPTWWARVLRAAADLTLMPVAPPALSHVKKKPMRAMAPPTALRMAQVFMVLAIVLSCSVPFIILGGIQRAINQSARTRQRRHEETLAAIREGKQHGPQP